MGFLLILLVIGIFFYKQDARFRKRCDSLQLFSPRRIERFKALFRTPFVVLRVLLFMLLLGRWGGGAVVLFLLFYVVYTDDGLRRSLYHKWQKFFSSGNSVINGSAGSSGSSSSTHSSFAFSFSSAQMHLTMKKVLMWMVGVVLIIVVLSSGLPVFTVSPGEVGLLVRLGKLQDPTYTEGLHFKIPLIDRVVKINIQTQKVESSAYAASKDLQNISATIAVNGNISPASAKDIYRNLGDATLVADKIINPSIQESVKAATAKYTAEELITKRSLVSQEIKSLLVEKLGKYGIVVSDVNIVNFQFSAEFDAAIEKKVKAEQEALAEKNKLESVKFQAQQKIEQAKAEAEAIRIQAEAIQNQGGEAYVNLKWIEKRDGKLPQTSLGEGNGVLLNLVQ